MKRTTFFLILLLCIVACNSTVTPNNNQTKLTIDGYLKEVIGLHNIPGLAVGVMQDGKITYQTYLGHSDIDKAQSVKEHTLFRIFSATKLITATAIFQLIQDGKLSLEDDISLYLDDLPNHWTSIKIENLISHSSGLPDVMRYKSDIADTALLDSLSNDEMQFETGDRFRYNQTNYWFLARIIEKVTDQSFEQFVLNRQFSGNPKGVTFSSNASDSVPNRAVRYNYDGRTDTFKEDTNNNGRRAHSGNGLNITLERFMEWNQELDNGTILNQKSKHQMWSPFNYSNVEETFLHGWGRYKVNELESYGFTGGNLAAFRKFESANTTIVLLSNGYQIPAYDIIVNDIARMVIPDLIAEAPILEETIMSAVLRKEYAQASVDYAQLREENINTSFDNLKWNINSHGNNLLWKKKMEAALDVFRFNVEANPEWWVSVSSLGEAYDANNDIDLAISFYKRAIALNEDNQWDYNTIMKDRIEKLSKKPQR